ncbi:uncharacterized protein LOC118789205 [Megalops cyprinoides]|uniref:uncharacterized protein LOC118789205 n=1 Tax=Megalops cyprinoides TaxID=118141 RepID=UPI001864E89E|nr:uncharacterized protein LOC118789205 [Megalops cyprinoides]
MAQVSRSVGEALWGMCAADAMSMPVHWYYNIGDIKNDFGGWITGFEAPKNRHPSSILTLSNSGGSGRSSLSSEHQPPVVGNIILHDKLKFWKFRSGSVHYHQGLRAGENTLNTLCALRVVQTLAGGKFGSVAEQGARAEVLADYVQFLTTPGTHDDTYAESFHRVFFADWQEERPTSPSKVLEFAERRYKQKMNVSFPDSQLNAIGCLPMAIPFVLLSATADEEQAVTAAVEFVRLTHPHPKLDKYVALYARVLHATLNGACLRQQAEAALKSPTLDVWDTCRHYMQKAARFSRGSEENLKVHQSAVASLGLACYTEGALRSLFYLAHEFHDDPRGGILANTNCGGENCNRGAALGALLGARAGHEGGAVPREWKQGLVSAQEQIPAILAGMP